MMEEYDVIDAMVDELASRREGWQVKDDADADWQIERIAAIKADLRRKEMAANAKIAQIQQWLQKEKEAAEKEIAFREMKLREYFESLPAKAIKETKTQKSYKLPSGTLKLKQQQPEFIKDENTLLAWVKANKPRFVRIKESVDWAGLKELVGVAGNKVIDTQTGEVIDGIEVVEREPKFIVEVE